MSEQVRVELVRREVPADEQTLQGRAALVERMRNLGQLDPQDDGQVSETVTGWFARVNGVEFPVVTYSVEPPDDGGHALVSLLVPADSVRVGDPPTGAAPPKAPPVEEKPPTRVWGSAGMPDPREGIPGWTPELGAQVAANATPQHDHTLAKWTCGCDPVLLGIQAAAAKSGNIDLRVMQA